MTRILNYLSFITWFFLDSFYRWKFDTIITLVAGLFGIVFQLGAFATLILYISYFTSGESFYFAGIFFDPRRSLETLYLAGLVFIIFLIFSSFCTYLYRTKILRIARNYEEFCSKRVFYLFRNRSIDNSSPLRLVRGDAKFLGRVLRIMFAMFVPLIKVTLSLLLIFYLDHVLSFFIIFIGLVPLFFQYFISVRASNHTKEIERLTPASITQYKNLIQIYKNIDGDERELNLEDQIFISGPNPKLLDAVYGRLRCIEDSSIVSYIFIAIVLGLILFLMASKIIFLGVGWEKLLIYIIALKFLLFSLKSIFSSLVAISRFYPQVNRYKNFVLASSHY